MVDDDALRFKNIVLCIRWMILLLVVAGSVKKIRKPKPWKHPQPITKAQLMQLREEFWDTAPHYGGRKGN